MEILKSVALVILMVLVFTFFLAECCEIKNRLLLEWRRDDIIAGSLEESKWRSNFKFLCRIAIIWLLFLIACQYILFLAFINYSISWEEMSVSMGILKSVVLVIPMVLVFIFSLACCSDAWNKILLEWRRDDIIPGSLSQSEWRSEFKFLCGLLCVFAILSLACFVAIMYLFFLIFLYVISK